MEEKDYIYINDKNGKKIKMELIIAINSLDGKFQYIAYKEENKFKLISIAKAQNLTVNQMIMDETSYKLIPNKIIG